MYRILLRYLCDIGKLNHLIKVDPKTTCMVKTDMKIFFESNRPFNPIVDPEIKITFHNVSSIQYEQLRLNDNF